MLSIFRRFTSGTNITLLSNKSHGTLQEVLQNIKVVSAFIQPTNLKELLIRAKFQDKPGIEKQIPPMMSLPLGLYANCKDSRCKLCKLRYIQPCTAFECSNGPVV